MPLPTLSIVVPAYNAASTLAACLRALSTQLIDDPYEIILVDDGSTDSTPRIAQTFAPAVRVIRRPHSGAAAARNAGVRAARGDIVLFTDADCEPVPTWASRLAAAIRSGADGAKGTYRTRQRSLVARFVQAEYESKYRHMQGRSRIDFIDTYSAAYRRDVLIQAGGFNENLPVDEDQELSFRLSKAGRTLIYVPQAVVYHHHVTSPLSYARRKFRIGYWKVFVGAIHPQRMVTDSHTPQTMKLEMLITGIALPALALSPLSSMARKLGALSSLGLLLLTLPFAARVARHDPTVAVVAPPLLLLRSLALTCGFLAGTLRLVLIHVARSQAPHL
jgi:glycosyltransferase involved in cell wall biosynthesis